MAEPLGPSASMQVASGGAAPEVVGVGAQLTLAAFLVVMLVVPWLMSRPFRTSSGEAPSRDGFFTSRRERKLWIWATAVVLAIYSTLAPAAPVAAALRSRGLLGPTTTALFLVVVVAVSVPWLRQRPGRVEVGAALGILAVYMTTLIRMPVPEARSHLFEYGVLALLVHHALLERRRNGGYVPLAGIAAIVVTALIGWCDEILQAFIPSRTYDMADVGFNGIAATMAVLSSALMGWARGLKSGHSGGGGAG